MKKIRIQNEVLIAGGDWNCVQNKKVDTSGFSYAYLPNRILLNFRKNNNLVDVWRKMFIKRKQYYVEAAAINIYSRLDYWLMSKERFSNIFFNRHKTSVEV